MKRSFLPLVLLFLLLMAGSGCSRPVAAPEPPAPVAPAPVAVAPAPAPPTVVGFTVRVGVAEVLPNSGISLDEPPESVTVAFPVAMDRALAEKALVSGGLPPETRFTWTDDKTVRLSLPEAPFHNIDAKGAFSQDGTAVVESQPRALYIAPMREISFYRLPDLLADRSAPVKTYRLRTAASGFALSPDGEHLLTLGSDPYVPSPPPRLVHLPTGTTEELSVPGRRDNWFCCGGWLPDGRLYLVGQGKVYVREQEFRVLAEASAWSAYVSPDGKQLALWWPGDTSNVALVDLNTGATRQIPGSFRPQAQDGASRLSWSPDGKLLAGTEGSGGRPEAPRIRIVDVATGQEVRSISGYMLDGWLATGDLLAWPWPWPTDPAGQPKADLLSPTGEVKRRGLDAGTLSPDGRWAVYDAGAGQYGLHEIATGRTLSVPARTRPWWSGPDLLYTVTQ